MFSSADKGSMIASLSRGERTSSASRLKSPYRRQTKTSSLPLRRVRTRNSSCSLLRLPLPGPFGAARTPTTLISNSPASASSAGRSRWNLA